MSRGNYDSRYIKNNILISSLYYLGVNQDEYENSDIRQEICLESEQEKLKIAVQFTHAIINI